MLSLAPHRKLSPRLPFFVYHDYNPLCLYGLAGVLLSPLLCKKNHQRYQYTNKDILNANEKLENAVKNKFNLNLD
jgi:hypothetical protein